MNNVVDLRERREADIALRGKVLNVLEATRDWMTVRQVRDLAAPLSHPERVLGALNVLCDQGAIEAQRATQGSVMLYRYSETDL